MRLNIRAACFSTNLVLEEYLINSHYVYIDIGSRDPGPVGNKKTVFALLGRHCTHNAHWEEMTDRSVHSLTPSMICDSNGQQVAVQLYSYFIPVL